MIVPTTTQSSDVDVVARDDGLDETQGAGRDRSGQHQSTRRLLRRRVKLASCRIRPGRSFNHWPISSTPTAAAFDRQPRWWSS